MSMPFFSNDHHKNVYLYFCLLHVLESTDQQKRFLGNQNWGKIILWIWVNLVSHFAKVIPRGRMSRNLAKRCWSLSGVWIRAFLVVGYMNKWFSIFPFQCSCYIWFCFVCYILMCFALPLLLESCTNDLPCNCAGTESRTRSVWS